MKAAIRPMYARGLLRSEKEIEEAGPVVGELTTSYSPREPGGKPRHVASIAGAASRVQPMIEPRLVGIAARGFKLRGLEEIQTANGIEYRLQEWVVEEAR
jgi:hypothetical protein